MYTCGKQSTTIKSWDKLVEIPSKEIRRNVLLVRTKMMLMRLKISVQKVPSKNHSLTKANTSNVLFILGEGTENRSDEVY